MDIDDFLKQFVEGYLFNDLESMASITVPSGKSFGGVGYPMVATVCAGMELLGELLTPNADPFDPNKGNDYFLNYWDSYFSQQYPEYTGLGRLFRQLMRNGITHTFVAKPGIFVEKGPNRQMSIDTTRQEIYIDCNVFFREFEDSYKKLVRPIVDVTASTPKTTKANMQARLDSMSIAYTNYSSNLFSELPTLNTSTNNTSYRELVPVSPLFASWRVQNSGASPALSGSMETTTTPTPSTTLPFEPSLGTLPPKTKP